jgi:hypothetical protein
MDDIMDNERTEAETIEDVIGRNPRVKQVGNVAVDSGQIMITDPCYLGDYKANEFTGKEDDPIDPEDFSYNTVCKITVQRNPFGQVYRKCVFVSSTLGGDGYYPVYAILDENGRPKQLIIDFETWV